jgi:Domain of unknown function (DUF4348)
MQNLKIWIVIVLFLIIGILYKNHSPNKDFDQFFDKFYTDQNLQLKSVKFPLNSIGKDKKITFITKNQWIELGNYNLVANSYGSQKDALKNEYINADSVHVIFKLDVGKIHANVIHKFVKINNQWFLVEIEDQSTGTKDLIKSK